MSDSSKIALVTGASRGIGLEVARQLGEAGACVLLGARDARAGTAAARQLGSQAYDVTFLQLDTCDQASIASAAAAIADAHGRLDILVNNAGISDSEDGPPSHASIDAVRRVLETNFVGTLAVTQAMLPLLRASDAARIVNLASALGSLALNGDPESPFYAARTIGYNASKAALNMLTVQLSAELSDTAIAVNSVSPGFVKTGLNPRGNLTPADGAVAPVRYALLDQDAVSGKFVRIDGELPW